MDKLDKVIKGLTECNRKGIKDERCENCCPYFFRMPCINTLMTDALELLKKQPKKGEWIIDEYGIHHCPFCKAINVTVYQNFCHNCGADMRKDGDGE